MLTILDRAQEYFITGNIVGFLRTGAWLLVVLFMFIFWWRARKRSKRITAEEDEKFIKENYEKNEDGLYPWEVDTDLSEKNIKEGAQPMNTDDLPKRGQWR